MKTFNKYVEDMEKSNLIERPQLNDDALLKLITLAYKKFRKQTDHFFERLSDMDYDIKRILLGHELPKDNVSPDVDPNKDEVIPPDADGSSGLEANGSENQ